MNVAYQGPWPQLAEADALLMDVARRIQLTKTKHEAAERNFRALCQHVDREGSPLHQLVSECYPSGSFAIGTAIASRVAKDQHDVDVVIELNISSITVPHLVIDTLYDAINGDPNSRYYGKVAKKSRCVTVTYEDNTTVDLMPVARFDGGPKRAGNVFHHKPKTGEEYHKAVNPWGFANYFNSQVEYDAAFYDALKGRRLIVEGELIKAETQPMPDHAPLEEKSPRVVALQIIKRNRDIAYRQQARRGLRKPPAVVLAAIALEAGPVQASLVDEVISVANAIRQRLTERNGPRGALQVFNPAYMLDEFTDRWPENRDAQAIFNSDLRRLITELNRLKNEELGMEEKSELLKRLFGETAALYAVESMLKAQRHEMEAGRFNVGPKGKVLTGASPAVAAGIRTTAAKGATRTGGGHLPE